MFYKHCPVNNVDHDEQTVREFEDLPLLQTVATRFWGELLYGQGHQLVSLVQNLSSNTGLATTTY